MISKCLPLESQPLTAQQVHQTVDSEEEDSFLAPSILPKPDLHTKICLYQKSGKNEA